MSFLSIESPTNPPLRCSPSFSSPDSSPKKTFSDDDVLEVISVDSLKQRSESSCGKTAVAILLTIQGYPYASQVLNQDVPHSAFGYSKQDLIALLQKQKVPYKVTEFPDTELSPNIATKDELIHLRDLLKLDGPGIVPMREMGHIIVMEHISEQLDKTTVSDPYDGRKLIVHEQALKEKAFGGVYLIQIPKYSQQGCCCIL